MFHHPDAAGPPSPKPPQPVRSSLWTGDVLARSVRFALTLMGPILASILIGTGTWMAYAVLAGILGFVMDTGGSATERFRQFGCAGFVILAGTAIGTLVEGNVAATAVVVAVVGAIYAVVESSHTSAAFAARFLCITVPIGAFFAPLTVEDILAVAALVVYASAISILWDAATGVWRPSETPRLADIVAHVRAAGLADAVLALIVAATVAAAFLTAEALGIKRAYWTLFAIVLIVHADERMSWRLAIQITAGTLIGSAAALAYGSVVTSELGVIAGMTLAALLRWPAEALTGILGFASLTTFIILLFKFISLATGVPTDAAVERSIDMSLGSAFAVAAIAINHFARWLILRWRAA